MIHEETISEPCWICGKRWKRKDMQKYGYFNNTLVCLSHESGREWYNASIKMGSEKLKFSMERK